MAPRLFEQKETKLCGISYGESSLGEFTLLDSRLETRLIYRYLSDKPRGGEGRLICPASVCCLMHDIRNRKVPSNILNLFSDTTNIHSYNSRSSPSRLRGKIWNEIPASLREQLLPKKRFKTKLHSFLVDILMKHDDYIDISQITSALKTYK